MQSIAPRTLFSIPGVLALLVFLGLLAVGPGGALVGGFLALGALGEGGVVLGITGAMVAGAMWLWALRGFTVLEPNQAAVALLFGRYVGTRDQEGWFYVNPLLSVRKVSLRLQTFETPHLKVNEKGGRPVEIGAVVTWAITEPETALLAVEDVGAYLKNRTEVALRTVAASHPYEAEDGHDCLRGNTASVSTELRQSLAPEAAIAGITIRDVTLTHLAYAPEIAGIMLVRQQAESLLAARRVIVEGAVRIASDALRQLESEGHVIPPTEKGRALTNLLTVLASERGTTPVVNVG